MKIYLEIKEILNKNISPFDAEEKKRFFNFQSYSKNEKFLGLSTPFLRKLSKAYSRDICFLEVENFLNSEFNEEKLLALFFLVAKYEKSKDILEKKEILNFYIKNINFVNNWNLTDSSAYQILGRYSYEFNHFDILYDLAKSENFWIKRIAIVSTYFFIKKNIFEHTYKISKILFENDLDILQKAVGWMLKEVGKRDERSLLNFIEENKNFIKKKTLTITLEKIRKKNH